LPKLKIIFFTHLLQYAFLTLEILNMKKKAHQVLEE
jgi:hypothetical protein